MSQIDISQNDDVNARVLITTPIEGRKKKLKYDTVQFISRHEHLKHPAFDID
jgi:hypothetical protein